jgi:tetratricopeptide (TPR) repeat protein
MPVCLRPEEGSNIVSLMSMSAEALASRLIETGRLDEAIDVRRQTLSVLERQPKRAVDDKRLPHMIRSQRCILADLLERANRSADAEELWFLAAREFATNPGDAGPRAVLYPQALISLILHDQPAYRRVCAAVLDQSAANDQQFNRNWTIPVWTCVISPDAVDDYGPIVELARELVRRTPESQASAFELGAVLYRAGQFHEALEALHAANGIEGKPKASPRALIWYFLSLAHSAAGLADEAQSWFGRAEESIVKALADRKTEDGRGLSWEDPRVFELLRTEAALRLKESAKSQSPH